jgi:hypothetical protein
MPPAWRHGAQPRVCPEATYLLHAAVYKQLQHGREAVGWYKLVRWDRYLPWCRWFDSSCFELLVLPIGSTAFVFQAGEVTHFTWDCGAGRPLAYSNSCLITMPWLCGTTVVSYDMTRRPSSRSGSSTQQDITSLRVCAAHLRCTNHTLPSDRCTTSCVKLTHLLIHQQQTMALTKTVCDNLSIQCRQRQ